MRATAATAVRVARVAAARAGAHELMSHELSPSSISLLCSLLDARALLAAVHAVLVMSHKTMFVGLRAHQQCA